jgi:hypothetical protein
MQQDMTMKTTYNYLGQLMIAAVIAFGLAACEEEVDPSDFTLSRNFSVSTITAAQAETKVTLSWPAALFTTPGSVSYHVAISDSPGSFSNPTYEKTTTELNLVVTDDALAVRKDYFAQITTIGAEGTSDSKATVFGPFRITGEQFLFPVTTDKVIDTAVKLDWKISADLTKLVLTPPGGAPVEFTLTAAEKAAGTKQINGLTGATAYTAEIYAGTKNKGIIQFTTKAGLVGNIIDLRNISVVTKPNILTDTLPDISSGSIVLLKRGLQYGISSTANFNFNKSVTIQSGMDFGTDLASLRMSAAFNVVAGSVIDSIVFKDLNIKGGRPNRGSYDADYIMNANAAATISKVRLENCNVNILRGVFRGQAAGAGVKYGSYFINNCKIDSIKDFAVAAANNTSAFATIRITNSTFYRIRKLIIHAVAGNNSVTLDNVTIYEAPGGAALATTNYMMDFGSNNSAGGIAIRNTIFGKTWDETGAGTLSSGIRAGSSTAINSTNSYATNDFVNNSSAIPGLSTYSGSSTALFVDPVNFNFKIKDNNFAGKSSAGDPRWR